jgi:hypothetical protein
MHAAGRRRCLRATVHIAAIDEWLRSGFFSRP